MKVQRRTVGSSRQKKLFEGRFASALLLPFTRSPFPLLTLVFCSLTLLVLACGHAPPGRGAGEVETTSATTEAGQSATNDRVSFRVETVVANLEVPWSIVWAPDGRMLFTERAGRVRAFQSGKLQTIFTVPDVAPSGEGGLMSVVLHPQFASNHWIYLSYVYSGDNQNVRVVRYRESDAGFTDRKVIIESIPAAQYHAGCRVRFGTDGKLYITTGDATRRDLAQRLDSLAGKILRLNDDGSIPADNPFAGQKDARGEIWSYGHRNPQGIDWQPDTNLLFETEHGPSGFDGPGGGDEVNIIEKGKNYGWPVIHHTQTQAGMEAPLLEYTPACAPASGMFYRGAQFPMFPNFRGNFFFGCLRGARLIRVVLDGRRVVRQENLLEGKYGRIRDVAEGPDGYLYFSTSNKDDRGASATDDDRIIKLVPVK